ncbi:class I SAM-dependent methyltransferase [Motilimonas pumila]|uniref:Class I SAM-dependent methyltransferase n=1 Tax=Motilimonas pumila TaxID=2303987 RepID=A0A418YH15_9GAMM|nr:class I SAM-dependent methyltransferase [Motilimonas pumila]RJG49009.1 class I SAM-dependent methyltransferase [Motilimonas pumila]
MEVLTRLCEEIIKLNPTQKSFLKHSQENLSPQEWKMFCAYVEFCLSRNISLPYLASCYDLIVKDTFTEQIFFKRHGKYRFQKYAQVAESVYHNPEYMEKYMYGLALSTFLWPNHLSMHRFFLECIPANTKGHYLEVGPGHGFYFTQAAQVSSYQSFTGVDISATSVAMTQAILASGCLGKISNTEILHNDFLQWQPERKYECVVMAEVLEHVEQPEQFLEKIYQVTNISGKSFITTCINAPAIDHIYLYEDLMQLQQQVKQVGFNIERELVVPYSGLSLEQSMKQKLPVNVAMLLAK